MELCPLAPLPKSLTMFLLSIILCEFSIFDQQRNETAYLRPIKYKIFL